MTTADTSPPAAVPTAHSSRWIKIVAGALLLCVVLLVSSWLTLDSTAGQNLLARSLGRWLSGPGSQVEVSDLHGQAPLGIGIGRLTWADREGVWLEIEQLRLLWSPTEWWHLHIQEVGADQVHLHRPPRFEETPNGADGQPAAQPDARSNPLPSASSPGPDWSLLGHLPPVLVDHLRIAQLILDAEVYGQTGQEARFALAGEIRHTADPAAPPAQAETKQLLAKLLLRPLDGGDTRLNLEATLSPVGPIQGDSRLTLAVDGYERSGLVAALTGLAAAKGATLHLAGQGPLSAWQGTLAATLEGVGTVQGQMDGHYADHSTLRWAGRATGAAEWLGKEWLAVFAQTGRRAEKTKQPPPAGQTASLVALDLAGQVEWAADQTLRLSQLTLDAPFAHVQGQGRWEGSTGQGQGELQVTIPQLAALTPLVEKPLRGALAATLTAQGSWPHPHLQLTTQVVDPAMAGWQAKQMTTQWEGPAAQPSGTMTAAWHGQGHLVELRPEAGFAIGQGSWEWSAEVVQPVSGPLQLTQVALTDHNMTAQLQGQVDLEQGSGQGHWQVTLARLGDWLKQGWPELAPSEGHGQWSGLFTLTPPTGAGQNPVPPGFTTTLTGTLAALHHLPDAAQLLLGTEVQTEAKLAVWPGERLEVTDLHLQGQGVQGEGSLRMAGTEQRLAGQLRVQIPQLAPFSALAGLPLQGGVQADTHVTGTVSTPHVQVGLQSAVVDLGPVHWQHPDALLTIDGWDTTPHGTLQLDVAGLGHHREQESDGQTAKGGQRPPMDHKKMVSKGPDAPKTGAGSGSATCSYRLAGAVLQLADLHLPWPGGELTGERMQIDLARGILDGRLQGKSSAPGPWGQWLAGADNPLPADLDGTLTTQWQWTGRGRQQGVEADLDLQFIRSAQWAQDGFGMLDKASLKVRLADLWGEANGTLEGSLGKLRWGNAQVRNAQWRVAGSRQSAQVTLSGKGLLPVVAPVVPPVALPAGKRPTVEASAQEGFDLEASGTLGMDDHGVMRGTLAGLTGHLGPDVVQLGEAAHMVLTPDGTRLDLDRLLIHYGPAYLAGHAHYDPQRVDIGGEVRLPLALATRLGGPDLQGSAQAHLQLSGSASQPDGQFTLQLDQVHGNDPLLEAIPPATLRANARLEKGQVSMNVALQDLTSRPITALLSLPVQIGFAPLHWGVPGEGAVSGTLDADAQLTQFGLLAAPDWMDTQKLDGQVNMALRLGGTVANPDMQGEIQVRNGSYENGSFGTVVKGVHLDAKAHGRTLVLEKLEANDGGQGLFRVTGQLALDGEHHFPFQLHGILEKTLLVRRDEWQVTMSGPLVVQGNGDHVDITGTLTNNELVLTLADSEDVDTETVPIDSEIRDGMNLTNEADAKPSDGKMVALNIALHLPSRVFVRGRGLDSEWQGDLVMRGDVDDPRLEGQVLVRKGVFEFLDQKFELRKGIIAFDGSGLQPNLDLEAETKNTNNMVALLRLQGPAFTPALELGSEPDLPQDEILARLLFNRNRQQLSPAQAVSLAVAVEKLRSGGPDLLGKAKEGLGVDRLELGGDSVETGSIKAGKYVRENVLLGVEHGVKQGSGKVSVELEMTPNLTLQTEMDEANKSGVGVNWKYDY
ncbi:MAG: translocation/assembly module TamB domain-containing protein [Magnetococcales bacterium]|nr:translocation/assembly module TamB domain-containing protein [Magnetococcales bacterium]